jgi:putative membrane protein
MISGMIMGMAEVIPGVSGGTVAFVAGIYERLLSAVNGVKKLPGLIKEGRWKDIITELDLPFLVKLGSGMVVGIVVGVLAITHFLESHPPVVWALFFGLILASTVYMAYKVNWRNWECIVFGVIGIVIALGIGFMTMGGGSTSLLFVFFSGMIAIVALVLPGISGSFILLLLGMYTYIVRDQLKGLIVDFSMDKLLVMIVFGMGCLVGLLSIARVLEWAFQKYRSVTIALLTGFMAGAMPKIWPWREATLWMDKATGVVQDTLPSGEYKVIEEVLVNPLDYSAEPFLIPSVVAMIVGIGLILLFWKWESRSAQL